MSIKTKLTDDAKRLLSPATRRRILVARMKSRSLTADRRSLPDFLVIGTERGGTSSLYKYLGRHPEIAPSLRKETEYFNRHYGKDLSWYRSHFQLEARRRSVATIGRKSLSFEATPTYLQDPRVAKRVASLLPDAKLIVLLRNPVARAWSGWKHMTELGFETMPFSDAIAAESGRTTRELEKMLDEPLYFSRPYHRYGYVDRGKYAEQLERWFGLYPRENVLIIESEKFYGDTGTVYGTITEFLEVSPWAPDEFRMYSSATSKDPISAADEIAGETRLELEKLFQPHNRRLAAMLGTEFSWTLGQQQDQ